MIYITDYFLFSQFIRGKLRHYIVPEDEYDYGEIRVSDIHDVVYAERLKGEINTEIIGKIRIKSIGILQYNIDESFRFKGRKYKKNADIISMIANSAGFMDTDEMLAYLNMKYALDRRFMVITWEILTG